MSATRHDGGETNDGPERGDGRVVPLRPDVGVEPPAPPPPSRPGRLHGVATAGMAVCALVGIAAMLLFVTVGWPGETRRYPMTVFVFAVVGFMTCASIAVFAAARDTYPRRGAQRDRDPGAH